MKTIGKYSLGSLLGKGGHSKVYKASLDGEVYAIKSIVDNFPESYLTEWSFMTLLSHPNIVQYHNVVVDEPSGTINFVMPRMECTLYELKVSKGTLSEDELRIIIWQILSVLDYLHNNHIVHRDLKAYNIMMVSKDSLEIQVIDFGLAKMLYPEQGPLWKELPTSYPPEIEKGIYTTAMDIWSLGMTIFDLLLPKHYFLIDEDRDIWQDEKDIKVHIMEGKVHDHLGSLSISDPFKDLILSLLTINHELRPTASWAMHHPWFHGLVYEPPRLLPTHSVPTTLPPVFISSLNKLGTIYGYSPQVITYAIKLASKIYTFDSSLITYSIRELLLSIAGFQMDEQAYNDDSIVPMVHSNGYPLLFEIFKALDHSIIIV